MEKLNWNDKLDYLKTTRKHFWNDDYLEFLVKSVWKLEKPTDIIDFGCGFGYLGMKLLPLLPEGSTYTGVDIASGLLDDARQIFGESPYETNFICADLTTLDISKSYGLVICQAVLRHIPDYKKVLNSMVKCCKENGIVACIEVNRRMENTGLYYSSLSDDFDFSDNDSLWSKNWLNEIKNGGRDYLTGSKIPILMESMGLNNVSIRMNDFVEFISPNQNRDNYHKHLNGFLEQSNMNIESDNEDSISIINARCLMISYGTK